MGTLGTKHNPWSVPETSGSYDSCYFYSAHVGLGSSGGHSGRGRKRWFLSPRSSWLHAVVAPGQGAAGPQLCRDGA